MIVEQQLQVFSGFQACIAAALQGGCRAYFASPSPLHAQLLNEGARRFPEQHGSFVQASHPVDALSMALGASRMGVLPLVSGNFPDFLAMQEVLQSLFKQECPCVLALLLYQEPVWPEASPLAYPYPCFLDPWPACGLPLISLMPSSLAQLYQLTWQACQLALSTSQPVAVLLDPLLLAVTGDVQVLPPEPLALEPGFGHIWLERLDEVQQRLQLQAGRWLRQWIGASEPEYFLLATGLLGGWLLQMEWPRGGVLVPESLFPLALEALPPQPVYVVEFAPSALSRRLVQRFGPGIQALELPWERALPAGLKNTICRALEAKGHVFD
ncbi:MAG: hypothetical protein ACAI44_33210 [Candidatus Sericytochromatia bacterium]